MKGATYFLSALVGDIYDWVIGILKKRIVLAKSRDWSCNFFSAEMFRTMGYCACPFLYVKRT